ncbi:hypothetical protein [Pseudonocardia parietis]|uniref:Uncharacterized protein n=1 Tax=Pseudonocardia parietis TaxID=570936 RepID=A0ABS4VW67_9PSEU|nr:hypothetical protein [Pseudonocardia parietis]MBP2368162.1 hypothetical protein [Pseudonocardia parietis]
MADRMPQSGAVLVALTSTDRTLRVAGEVGQGLSAGRGLGSSDGQVSVTIPAATTVR